MISIQNQHSNRFFYFDDFYRTVSDRKIIFIIHFDENMKLKHCITEIFIHFHIE